jgi:hypothetical protein
MQVLQDWANLGLGRNAMSFCRSTVLRTLAAAGLIVISATLIPGCSRQSQSAPPQTGHTIELLVEPNPVSVGPSHLWITLLSPDGEPIDGARVSARGDMTHAGMAPVFGEAVESESGRYRIPFEWTMGGDWILLITSTLSDDRIVERQIKISGVRSE